MPKESFEQLALIKVTGGVGQDLEQLMNTLTARAQSMGADAVISVQTADSQRQVGLTVRGREDDEVLDQWSDEPGVRVGVLSGTAIRFMQGPGGPR